MLFNSFAFILFFLVVASVYYSSACRRWQVEWLVLASLFFYAYEQPWLLTILILSATITSVASHAVAHGSRPRLAATLGVVINLGFLAFFKYNRLIFESIGADLERIGSAGQALLMLPLPIGISFYTFHGISLVVDTWRGKVPKPPSPSPIAHGRNTLLYLLFFPQLVAGPIVKAQDFMPQIGIKAFRDIDWDLARHQLVLGFFLKMVIADNLAQQTTYMSCPACRSLSSIDLIVLLVGYSAQIFADFCGYSLIAMGLATLLGYRLPENFNRPYIAQSLADFWRRWHISLSSFLREYLYLPLGGNRRGAFRTYLNLIIVMGLGGLWHGAAWSYAIWGLWHGAGLALERLAATHMPAVALPSGMALAVKAVRMALVFTFVTLGWLLFKLPQFGDVLSYLSAIAANTGFAPSGLRLLVVSVYVTPVIAYHAVPAVRQAVRSFTAPIEAAMLAAIILNSGSAHAFIYFQF
jgi:alginate O-acetyltransferase complex protein AlgI